MSNTSHSSDGLHPLIYRIMIGLAAVLIIGIYGFAGGNQAYNGLVLTAAILFVLVAIGIPFLLSRIWQRHRAKDGEPKRFRHWLNEEFELWRDHLKGGDAAAAMLLPIIAVSCGMVIFAIELHLVAPAGSH